MMREQYDCINVAYQSWFLQFVVVGSGISCRYNEEISESIRIIGKRPVFVPISLMKQYITGLFQMELKRIERLRKDVLPIEKVKLELMDIYITISII